MALFWGTLPPQIKLSTSYVGFLFYAFITLMCWKLFEARTIMVILCLAETKSSVILCLGNLIGIEHFQSLDCFLAGDDVKEKKLDPSIYLAASKVLNKCHTDSYRCLSPKT
ncbi:hypothetical protein P8452_34217 [Trifolium repens]|nr:hypothetical protein P8452_34217 [Trifolium repens]